MINIEALQRAMLSEAPSAFGDAWTQVKAFLPAELKKMAVQIADIAENIARFEQDSSQGYPPEAGKVLLRMQRRAFEAVLLASTALTLIAAERAINAVLTAARDAAGGILDLIL